MMKAIGGMLTYAALCGQVPEYHHADAGIVFTLKAINSRASIKRDGELVNADEGGRDMLSRWAYAKSSDPDKMSTRDIVVHLSTNVFAGSDTTAIAPPRYHLFPVSSPAGWGQISGRDRQRGQPRTSEPAD